MIILVADDEKLTRDGLFTNINWSSLGIDKVLLADDGINALEIAANAHPDILLTDVRMPKMDGIALAEKLQSINPSLPIIFMSGYSDKEYLKAAIRLKAVTYVEKPIDLLEIEAAIRQAISNINQSNSMKRTEELSLMRIKSQLATFLTTAAKEATDFSQFDIPGIDFPISKKDESIPFFTMLLLISHSNLSTEAINALISGSLNEVFSEYGLSEIHSSKQPHLFFYHMWSSSAFTDRRKEEFGDRLTKSLDSLSLSYRIILGKNVSGARHICESYNSCAIEMQNAFFMPLNSHCIYRHVDKYEAFTDLSSREFDKHFKEILSNGNENAAFMLIEEMFSSILKSHNTLPNQLKALYYSLLSSIDEEKRRMHILSEHNSSEENSLWGLVSSCDSIYELNDLLKKSTKDFFESRLNQSEDHSIVYMIKEYVASNFKNEDLSIKDISEHVNLSTTYLCTLFKSETGQTLNQYLTDYRVEYAKKLLNDPRNKISEISSKVGYRDGNYFGKLFKKQVGLSPSEYRDSVIKHT